MLSRVNLAWHPKREFRHLMLWLERDCKLKANFRAYLWLPSIWMGRFQAPSERLICLSIDSCGQKRSGKQSVQTAWEMLWIHRFLCKLVYLNYCLSATRALSWFDVSLIFHHRLTEFTDQSLHMLQSLYTDQSTPTGAELAWQESLESLSLGFSKRSNLCKGKKLLRPRLPLIGSESFLGSSCRILLSDRKSRQLTSLDLYAGIFSLNDFWMTTLASQTVNSSLTYTLNSIRLPFSRYWFVVTLVFDGLTVDAWGLELGVWGLELETRDLWLV